MSVNYKSSLINYKRSENKNINLHVKVIGLKSQEIGDSGFTYQHQFEEMTFTAEHKYFFLPSPSPSSVLSIIELYLFRKAHVSIY